MKSVTAKLFKNGQSQVVHIPKSFQFTGTDEVLIRQSGHSIIITPKRKSWTSMPSLASSSDTTDEDNDFMQDRPDLLNTNRVNF